MKSLMAGSSAGQWGTQLARLIDVCWCNMRSNSIDQDQASLHLTWHHSRTSPSLMKLLLLRIFQHSVAVSCVRSAYEIGLRSFFFCKLFRISNVASCENVIKVHENDKQREEISCRKAAKMFPDAAIKMALWGGKEQPRTHGKSAIKIKKLLRSSNKRKYYELKETTLKEASESRRSQFHIAAIYCLVVYIVSAFNVIIIRRLCLCCSRKRSLKQADLMAHGPFGEAGAFNRFSAFVIGDWMLTRHERNEKSLIRAPHQIAQKRGRLRLWSETTTREERLTSRGEQSK